MVLKQQFAGQEWTAWPGALRQREPQAMAQVRSEHAAAISALIQEQYRCYCQWQDLRQYATQQGVALFGDMPIFVAYDSADVWAHPELFLLNADGEAERPSPRCRDGCGRHAARGLWRKQQQLREQFRCLGCDRR